MAEATYLPYHYVDYLRHPGIPFSGGVVALNQYMCKTMSNGGNDSATSLYTKLRWLKDGGKGPTLNTLVGGGPIDIALKGQGTPSTFAAIWNFMCRNKEQLKKLKVEVCGRRQRNGDGDWEKNVLRTGNVYDLYFDGRSDQQAIQLMVGDRFFGIDCIGFTSGVLIFNNEWTKYHGGEPLQWAKWFCTVEVDHAKDIQPLDFMIWDGHIAMIDWVWNVIDEKTVEVESARAVPAGHSTTSAQSCSKRVKKLGAGGASSSSCTRARQQRRFPAISSSSGARASSGSAAPTHPGERLLAA